MAHLVPDRDGEKLIVSVPFGAGIGQIRGCVRLHRIQVLRRAPVSCAHHTYVPQFNLLAEVHTSSVNFVNGFNLKGLGFRVHTAVFGAQHSSSALPETLTNDGILLFSRTRRPKYGW